MRTLVTTYLFPNPKWPAGIQAQDLLNSNWMFLPLSCWGNGRKIAHKLHIAALCESLSQIPTDSLLIIYKFSISLLTVSTVSEDNIVYRVSLTLSSLSLNQPGGYQRAMVHRHQKFGRHDIKLSFPELSSGDFGSLRDLPNPSNLRRR